MCVLFVRDDDIGTEFAKLGGHSGNTVTFLESQACALREQRSLLGGGDCKQDRPKIGTIRQGDDGNAVGMIFAYNTCKQRRTDTVALQNITVCIGIDYSNIAAERVQPVKKCCARGIAIDRGIRRYIGLTATHGNGPLIPPHRRDTKACHDRHRHIDIGATLGGLIEHDGAILIKERKDEQQPCDELTARLAFERKCTARDRDACADGDHIGGLLPLARSEHLVIIVQRTLQQACASL